MSNLSISWLDAHKAPKGTDTELVDSFGQAIRVGDRVRYTCSSRTEPRVVHYTYEGEVRYCSGDWCVAAVGLGYQLDQTLPCVRARGTARHNPATEVRVIGPHIPA